MKKCNNCQTLVPDEYNFCTGCGGSSFSPCAEPMAPAPMPQAVPAGMPVMPAAAPKKKTGMIVGICVGGAAALALIITVICILANVLNPANRFMKCIEEENYTQANQIYWEDLINNDKQYAKAYEAAYQLMEDLIQQYRDDTITYDEALKKLYGLAYTEVLGEAVYSEISEVEVLCQYREIYALAEESFNNGDYGNAIYYYGQVAGADFEHGEEAAEMYTTAVDAYRAEILTQVQGYIDTAQFGMAISLLQDALYVLPDDPYFMEKQQECADAEYSYTMQQFIAEARVYLGSNDYVSALACLDGYIELYPDETVLQQERNTILGEFEAYVIEASYAAAVNGDYQYAASLAASGLNYFSSTTVAELLNIYKSYIPVILGEMEMFQNNTEGGSWVTKTDEVNEYLEDNYGNVYQNSLSVGCGSITYLVNFKYQTFSGTVAFPKGLESDSYRESATLTVYGDGQKIAEFIAFNEASAPQDFTLDISTYEKITLEWTCEGANIWEDWGDFATIFDGLLVPIPVALPDSV